MLGPIRTYFFEKEKRKHIQSGLKRTIRFHFKRKNYYGLLLDAADFEHRKEVSALADQLRSEGNQVRMLGYVNGRNESIQLSMDVFTLAELTKVSGIPKSATVDSFLEQPFDVLINLSIHQHHRPLEYISVASKAAFRIGPWYPQQVYNPYDLCLDTGQQVTLKEWIDELLHTLQKIY